MSLLSFALSEDSNSLDSALTDLFSKSAGPAKLPNQTTLLSKQRKHEETNLSTSKSKDSTASSSKSALKRKKEGENKDIVERPTEKKRKGSEKEKKSSEEKERNSDSDVNENESGSESDDNDEEDATELPAHESLTKPQKEKKDKADPNELERTIFVGNLPVSAMSKGDYKILKSKFREFGKVESIRFRSIAFAELLPRKIAFIQRNLHPGRDTLNAYIVFEDASSVKSALSANGTVLLEKHIRVDSAAHSKTYDHKRSVFVGNLSLDAEEETLWTAFGTCGQVTGVRVVRDKATNVGKGFAYIEFAERSSVDLALKLHETKIGARKARVFRCKRDEGGNNKTTTSDSKGKPKPQTQSFPASKPDARGKAAKYPGGRAQARAQAKEKAEGTATHEGTRSAKGDKSGRIRARTVAWKKDTGKRVAGGKVAKIVKEKKTIKKVAKAIKKAERKTK